MKTTNLGLVLLAALVCGCAAPREVINGTTHPARPGDYNSGNVPGLRNYDPDPAWKRQQSFPFAGLQAPPTTQPAAASTGESFQSLEQRQDMDALELQADQSRQAIEQQEFRENQESQERYNNHPVGPDYIAPQVPPYGR